MVKALEPLKLGPNEIPYFAPGDGRTDANLAGQKAQMECERQLKGAFAKEGIELVRMHPRVDPKYGHGLIQDIGQAIQILSRVPKDSPIVAAFSQWAFNDRTGPMLWEHLGPILDATNFHGLDPGLVGALSHRSVLAMHEYKAQQKGYSLLWSSEQFKDQEARGWIKEWLQNGTIDHSKLLGYKKAFDPADHKEYAAAIELGKRLAENYRSNPRLIGVYDIGCMGMLNAALDERDLRGTGIKLARLNQVDLLARMRKVPEDRARAYIDKLVQWGFKLKIGENPKRDITDQQKVDSGQMYESIGVEMAELGLDAVTIAFQTGMNSSCASSDVDESMGNSTIRPAIKYKGKVFRKGRALRIGNEADIGMIISNLLHEEAAEAASTNKGIAELLTNKLNKGAYAALYALNDPRWWVTTGHDVRWGDMSECKDGTATYTNGQAIKYLNAFITALNLSGNMPVEHTEAAWTNHQKPWSGFEGRRHAYKYFEKGGICTKGLARPGEMIWSRVYKIGDELHLDIGRAGAVNLSKGKSGETERIWESVTYDWPLNEAVMYGVSRDSLMAGHMSNHISVSYAPDAVTANVLMFTIASTAYNLDYKVHLCGSFDIKDSIEYKVKNNLTVEGPYIRSA